MPEQNKSLAREMFQEGQNKPIGAREFIFRYLKYVPWILVSVALFLFLAFLKLRWSVPVYKVQSSLLINNEQGKAGIGASDDRLEELFLSQPAANLSNEMEILKSRPLIQRVVRDLGLERHYYNKGKVRSSLVYNPESPFQLDLLQASEADAVAFAFDITVHGEKDFTVNKDKKSYRFGEPFQLGPNIWMLTRNPQVGLAISASPEFKISWQTTASAADEVIGGLKIGIAGENSTILGISLETENIDEGKDILNTIMAVYDSTIIEDKKLVSNNMLKFIGTRLVTLEKDLGKVEGGLREFLVKNESFDLEGQSKIFTEGMGEDAKALAEQEIRMNVLKSVLTYIDDPKNAYDLVPTNLGIVEPVIQQYIAEYNSLQLQRFTNLRTTTEKNSIILGYDAGLNRIRQNLREALLGVKNSYEIANRSLVDKNNEIKGKLKTFPGKSMDAVAIERRQKILEELYSFLLRKNLETSLSSASTISNSRVIEPAIGSHLPTKPNRSSLYMTYLVFGLVIPIGIIAIFELLSDKVNNRVEIERATNTPILGEIGHSDETNALVVTRNSRKFISEQFRIIRTNLQYITGKNERPTIMVTSSFSGEGKSFVSTNIGAVMALTGKKTVIMEFDIRKPKILSGLDLKRKMGITNYIIGRAAFEDLAVPVEGVENLFVIPCGPIPPNPSELLLHPKLQTLMKLVKENFEVVIMDTAPVGLVSDAINLSQFADCTLYIVRSRHTVRRLLGLVDEIYTQKKLPALSILLNDVKLEGGYYGGYYGGYGYYGYGYGHEGGYFEKESGDKTTFGTKIKRWYSRWFS